MTSSSIAASVPLSVMPNGEDRLTMFVAPDGHRQCKLVTLSGDVYSAQHVLHYARAVEAPVPDFAAMVSTLRLLLERRHVHLVRGGLAGWRGKPLEHIRRRSRDRDNYEATVIDAPRRWLLLDFDALPADLDWRDLPACAAAAVAMLPDAFRGREHIAYATGSHGLPGKGARLRLVFHLSRAITCADTAGWLGDLAAAGVIDDALFREAQPIYVARPEREDGGPDHVAERLLHVPAQPCAPSDVQVPDVIQAKARASAAGLPALDPSKHPGLQDAVSELVALLPNGPEFNSQNRWLAFAHALIYVFGSAPSGLQTWLEWCGRRKLTTGEPHPDVDLDADADTYENQQLYREHRADVRFLVKAARSAGVPVPLPLAAACADLAAAEAAEEFTEDLEDAPPGYSGAPDPGAAIWPTGFRMTPAGLMFQPGNCDAEIWIAAPFEVSAELSSQESDNHALMLEWNDANKQLRELHLPRRLVHADGGKIAELLEDRGLRCAPGRNEHNRLAVALAGVRAPRRRMSLDRPGWHTASGGTVYAHPSGQIYGPKADELVVKRAANDYFGQARSLDEWKERVARFAVGNSRLALFISAAFAGPLLQVVHEPAGGFHLVGDSRCGKTTAAILAGSVWGLPEKGQVRAWRLTDNGLEAIAAETSDSILILDELSQVDARVVGDVVYMLANGTGKIRAQADTSARRLKHWQTFFLSTGEVTLAQKMATAGKAMLQGLGVRLPNVPADPGVGHGVYEALHGHPSGGALSDYLRGAAVGNHGTAAPAFLARLTAELTSDAEALRCRVAKVRDAFVAEHVEAGADGQVRSVASRFGLVAAAGELAIEYGILPWPAGEAVWAAAQCFSAWLIERGGTGAGEEAVILKQLRRFFTLNGESRFTRLSSSGLLLNAPAGMDAKLTAETEATAIAADDLSILAELDADREGVADRGSKTIRRVGYRREGKAIVSESDPGSASADAANTTDASADTHEPPDFLIFPEAWECEVCCGIDAKRSAKLIQKFGFLTSKEPGRLTEKVQVDGSRARYYVVSGRILDSD